MEETDMLKMLEQAATMSKLLNPEGAKAQEEWLEKMATMLDVMKLMKAMQPPPAPQKINEPLEATAQSRNFYDAPIQTPALQTIKAAIPHLDYRYQKKLGVMVKLIEIQKLLEVYNERVNALEEQRGDNWQRDMLQAIHPHMPEEKQNMLELLVKIMDIKKILENMQRLGEKNCKEAVYGI